MISTRTPTVGLNGWVEGLGVSLLCARTAVETGTPWVIEALVRMKSSTAFCSVAKPE